MFKFSPHIAVNVRGGDKAVKFYSEVLGLELVDRHTGKDCGIELKAGPMTLWLDGTGSEQRQNPGKVFFEFTVENLDAAVTRLAALGCTPGRETSGSSFNGRMMEDPYGLAFHLYQPH
ncbi:MAG TPA: VOC family protein [Bdellovibrionales bacterium]|nr:VOC family protein [Bdellovibrionales bacterium]